MSERHGFLLCVKRREARHKGRYGDHQPTELRPELLPTCLGWWLEELGLVGPRDAEEQVASVGAPRHKDLDNLAPRKGPGPAWPPEAASRALRSYPWCPRNVPRNWRKCSAV